MLFGVVASFLLIKTDLVFGVLPFDIYSDGLIAGLFFVLRIVLIIMLTSILTMTTSTTDINLGLEWLMYPLRLIKVPVSEIAMMLSLTLRFIPTLLIETDKIMKAQASRGIDFNEGNFFEKIKQIVTLLIPMFFISITRAEDLSNAMEARGYIIGAKRTSVDELKFNFKDVLGFIFISLILVFTILIKVF
jgi:energy-coupling factor transport system permease protein